MQVFLGDERDTPAGWHRVYWPDEAIALLETGEVVELSLDHDLGDDQRGTGYDVIVWIERAVIERGFRPPSIRVHSANPTARVRMLAGIEAVARAWARVSAGAGDEGQELERRG
ncbi:cyclic-phosphate processing receiver domain-containing protein [Pseudomonas sp. CGJS7]|uniref:cyclic-phosphate processing receiver domain-containing protein n=1 Tax=Pseudomonas sp. CGJS7 TaxID=3109348 RepID=UPI0030093ED3